MKQSEFLEITAILSAIKKSFLPKEVLTEEKIQIHFMFGLPMRDLAEDLVLFLSNLTDLPSDCWCTILQGQRTILQPNSKASKYDLTIGDDIELVTYELSQSNSMVTNTSRSSSSSIFLNHNEIRFEIECIRKFDSLYYVYNKFKKPWHLHIFCLIFSIVGIVFIRKYSRMSYLVFAIFLFEYLWLGYHFFLFILLRLYFSLSIFYIYSSDDLLNKKQIFKVLLKLTSLLVSSLWYFYLLIFSFMQLKPEQAFELVLILSFLSIVFCVFSVSLALFLSLYKGSAKLLLIFLLKLLIVFWISWV